MHSSLSRSGNNSVTTGGSSWTNSQRLFAERACAAREVRELSHSLKKKKESLSRAATSPGKLRRQVSAASLTGSGAPPSSSGKLDSPAKVYAKAVRDMNSKGGSNAMQRVERHPHPNPQTTVVDPEDMKALKAIMGPRKTHRAKLYQERIESDPWRKINQRQQREYEAEMQNEGLEVKHKQKENAEYLRQQIEMRSGGPNTVVAEKQAAADKLRADQDAYAAEARAKAEAKYKQRANMRVQYEKEIEETRRTRRLEKLRDTHVDLEAKQRVLGEIEYEKQLEREKMLSAQAHNLQVQSDNDKLREVRQKAAMAEHLRDKELLKELLARPEGVTKRPPPRIDPKREAFFANMREQLIIEKGKTAAEADKRIELLFQQRAAKEEAAYKAKERMRSMKQADYVKGLDESLQIKKARLREARKKEVALDARVLQVDRNDLAKERTDQEMVRRKNLANRALIEAQMMEEQRRKEQFVPMSKDEIILNRHLLTTPSANQTLTL